MHLTPRSAFGFISALALAWAGNARAQSNTSPFPASGYVGIGTTTPQSPLSISTGNNNPNTLELGTNPGGNYSYIWGLNRSSNTWAPLEIVASSTAITGGVAGIGTNSPSSVSTLPNVGYGAQVVKELGVLDNWGGQTTPITAAFVTNDGSWSAEVDLLSKNIGGPSTLLRTRAGGADEFWVQTNGSAYIASNLGIGTTAPTAPLALQPGNAAGPLQIANDSNSYITLGPWTTNGGHDYRIGIDGNTLWFGAFQGYRWYRTQTGSIDMVLTNGNLGIGTSNPTYPLSVNGTIEAKEVLVQTGWSDYVFDRNYQLEPLRQVERDIDSQHHLPGIPSAEEVAKNGVSMGEMEAKLLAKVEELTLHAIAQEKKLDQQAATIERLEGRINSLEAAGDR